MNEQSEIRFRENSYYNKLLKRKENGDLEWDKITKRELYFLNLVERVTDKEIGSIYGVSMDACRNKRKRNGIVSIWNNNRDELVQDIERNIWETLRHSKSKKLDIDAYYRILDAIYQDFNEVAK